jgi:hypothetical protein
MYLGLREKVSDIFYPISKKSEVLQQIFIKILSIISHGNQSGGNHTDTYRWTDGWK